MSVQKPITLGGKECTFIDRNLDGKFDEGDAVEVKLDKKPCMTLSHDQFQLVLDGAGFKTEAQQLARPVTVDQWNQLAGKFKYDRTTETKEKLEKVGNLLNAPDTKEEAEAREGVIVNPNTEDRRYPIEHRPSGVEIGFPQMDLRVTPEYEFPAMDQGMKVWLIHNDFIVFKDPLRPEIYIALTKTQYEDAIKTITNRYHIKSERDGLIKDFNRYMVK